MDKLDILQRDEFVKQLERIIKNISENKASTCFAINGKWGCGKTFVLDMLQEQLEEKQSEQTADNKYFIIRYNSWKYDYYSEPLAAIVAELMTTIEEKTALFPDSEEKQKILGALYGISIVLLTVFGTVAEVGTGLPLKDGIKAAIEGCKEGKKNYKEKHNYDEYLSLRKAIEELNEILKDLSEQHTILFLVDELDRCMPEYAIKVLERLHHLTEGKSNIITVISVDKEQLKCSIEKIFGIDNPDKYLEKFIQFEVKLDYGDVSEKITDKHADYIALFDYEKFPFNEPFEECLQAIFKEVDIRTQGQLVKKAMMAHKLLYNDKKDYSFMCMELLLAVMICVYKDESCFDNSSVDVNIFGNVFITSSVKKQPAFVKFFTEKFKKMDFVLQKNFDETIKFYVLPQKVGLYGAILYSWYWLHEPNPSVVVQMENSFFYSPVLKGYEELKKFAEMIKMMS